MDKNIFEYAAANKLRFPYKGSISVEDLYDLNVRDLDSIFKTLNREVKQVKEESLLEIKTKADETLEVQIEIVKYIVGLKLAEAEAATHAKEIKAQKQKIASILASKQDEALQNKSAEELQAMLAELS